MLWRAAREKEDEKLKNYENELQLGCVLHRGVRHAKIVGWVGAVTCVQVWLCGSMHICLRPATM